MRQIKFRAWDKKSERFTAIGLNSITFQNREINTNEDIILMQFTGLTDKNGVEIYEGDIVKWCYMSDKEGNNYYKKEVMEYKKVFGSDDMGTDMIGFEAEAEGGEVIGNIYQNPELLRTDTQIGAK